MRLRPRKVRDKLAFGVFGSNRLFLLSRAKFPIIAEEIAGLAQAEAARSPENPLRVLDAGIGRCRLQRLYGVRFPEHPVEWHGIDLLDFRIRLRIDVPGIRRVRGPIEQLPYADHSFDVLVCSWVLQHLHDPQRAIDEFVRVLKPGGRLILATPNSPQPVKFIQERSHSLLTAYERRRGKDFSYSPQIQFYHRRRLAQLLRNAGAAPTRWQGVGLVTGGPLWFLENYEWYYRFNVWLGARMPSWTKQLIVFSRVASRDQKAKAPI